MLRSMTGFGASSSEEGGHEIRVEIRSVNHRHLQVKTRTPHELSCLDHELERAVRKRLERGSVTLVVTDTRTGAEGTAALDVAAARRYRDEVVSLAKELGMGVEPSLETLLTLPGVVRAQEQAFRPTKAFERRLLALVDQALEALLAMREKEGRALAAALRKELTAIGSLAGRIEKRMPAVVRGRQRELVARLDELLGGKTGVTRPEDVAREVALLADRLDVAEELARLASHREQLRGLIDAGGAIGRRLDFLVQELFRELNTIGAKCSDAKVAHWVVDAKAHGERLREQLQNVE